MQDLPFILLPSVDKAKVIFFCALVVIPLMIHFVRHDHTRRSKQNEASVNRHRQQKENFKRKEERNQDDQQKAAKPSCKAVSSR